MIIITFSMAVLWLAIESSCKARDIIFKGTTLLQAVGAAVPAPGGLDLELVSATE
jgi:hypothetical protein